MKIITYPIILSISNKSLLAIKSVPQNNINIALPIIDLMYGKFSRAARNPNSQTIIFIANKIKQIL